MSENLPPLPLPWECGLCGAPPAYTAEHMRDYARAAVEAALAAPPQAEPVAWAQKAALDGVREYGEIICTLYADGYQPEQEWTEPLYAAPPPQRVRIADELPVPSEIDFAHATSKSREPTDAMVEAAQRWLYARGGFVALTNDTVRGMLTAALAAQGEQR